MVPVLAGSGFNSPTSARGLLVEVGNRMAGGGLAPAALPGSAGKGVAPRQSPRVATAYFCAFSHFPMEKLP